MGKKSQEFDLSHKNSLKTEDVEPDFVSLTRHKSDTIGTKQAVEDRV